MTTLHYARNALPGALRRTACGAVLPERAATREVWDVVCHRCRQTQIWQHAASESSPPDPLAKLREFVDGRLDGVDPLALRHDDTCDGCFGELDGDGFCGSPGCEGSTSGDDPDPEPGSWEWERQHGCMDCGVCDDCIERSRAHFEEMSDAD